MLNRLFYYGKVSDKQAQTIEEVKELKQQLTDKQSEQKKNVAATQKKVDELNAQQAEAQNVVNSLDSKLQAELAAEAEKNTALQAGINASTAEKATVNAETAGATENSNNDSGSNGSANANTNNGQSNNNQSGNTQSKPSTQQPAKPTPTPTPSTPNQSVDGGSVVSRAYSKLGCAYSWGGIGPNSFDCSGFVSYCLTGRYCRLGTTGTFMGWTRVSDPQPGDVVVNSYHTGIYIGNGQMIHASDYNTGVIISSVAAGMNNNYIFVRY